MNNTEKDRTPAGAPSQNHIDCTLASTLLSSISMATKQHPMPRKDLTVFAPESVKDRDRWIRNQIHKMRLQGTPICSSSGDGGYWIAKDLDEYLEFDRQYTKAAKQIFKASKAMRKTMNDQQDSIVYPNRF